MDFRIRVSGDFAEIVNIGELSKELVNWGRVLPNDVVREINDILREDIIDNSKEQISATGKKFKRLAKDYALDKFNSGFDPVPDLHFESRSFDNFKIDRDAAGPSARNRSIGHFSNRVQSEYMKAHQDGAPMRVNLHGAKNRLPERKFFPDGDDLMNNRFSEFRGKVEEILMNYLDRLADRRLRRGQK